jgi:hypothetical protein
MMTELGRHLTPELIAQLLPAGPSSFKLKSIPQGAAMSVWCAFVTTTEAIGGRYCEDCHVTSVTDDPDSRTDVRGYALDPAHVDALSLSESMVGKQFRYV